MALSPRLRLAGLLVLASCFSSGCFLHSLPYFLMGMPDPKHEARLVKLASDEKGKEVKVVLLAYCPTETRPEFIGVDNELCSILARHLQKGFKENKEKVKIVPPSKVKKFKDDHPDWHALEIEDIGKRFEADYVIYLEIGGLSLFEKGSGNQLYRGRASIMVSVYDLANSEEEPVTKHFDSDYPSRGAIAADDRNVMGFRQAFLEQVAKQLSWCFTAYSMHDEFGCD